MPASLYRLAGKQHHSEAPAPAVAEQISAEPVSPPVESSFDVLNNTLSIDDITHAPALVDDSASSSASVETEVVIDQQPAENDLTSASVSWDPAWTKAQLLEVALKLNLSVTSANTKTQIIEALTAATSN